MHASQGRLYALSARTLNKLYQIVRDYERGLLKNRPQIPSGGGKRPSPLVAFRVTGSNDVGGNRVTYDAKRQASRKESASYEGWIDSTTDTDTYTLFSPDEETDPGGSGHQEDDIVFAVRVGVDGGGAEWWIVGGVGAEGTADDPYDLTYTGNHGEEAKSDSGWDRSSQGENDGVIITVSTGGAYYSAGDERLYGFVRDFTYDSSGRLKLISDERRVEIANPAICGEDA
ncbi:hypothetical protein ACERK3_09735 [Phycisphaerales bacterium AB-hyl4]|uniref:Uncharacterized protein n=1 Tax=Natronomicrosphaera hydrolytica TaxID=3242702 RepID=A0ABV4U4Q1_9BACT